MKSGIELIAAERERQIKQEGWTPDHDDKHTDHELGKAAESYLVAVTTPDEEGDENGKLRPAYDWPWDKNWWKPSYDPVRNLVKAGALIAAEIDRLRRKELCQIAWRCVCEDNDYPNTLEEMQWLEDGGYVELFPPELPPEPRARKARGFPPPSAIYYYKMTDKGEALAKAK